MKKKSRLKKPVTKQQIEFATRLKNKRLEQNLSQQEVADKIGVSKVTLSRYETLDIVNIPSDKIEELSKIYKTSPAYLMGWEEDPAVKKDAQLPKLNKKDNKNIEKLVDNMKEQLLHEQGLMFDGKPASPEAIQSILDAMTVGISLAKQRNKAKYTPKKYRKDKE